MNDAFVYLRFNTGWMIFVKFSPKIWVMKTHFFERKGWVKRGCVEKTTRKSKREKWGVML